MKSFCTVSETTSKMKRQQTEWEKIFACDVSDNTRIYKELIQLNIKKANNWLKKRAEDLNGHFSKDIQLVN